MGLTVALTHNRRAEVLVRRIREVYVVAGPIAVLAWMPSLSESERAARRTGPIPGWRDAMRTLSYMGVDLELDAEEIETETGIAFMWPTPSDCTPLPFGHPALVEWPEDDELGFSLRVSQTGDQVNETPAVTEWYVAFNTQASVLEYAKVGATK